MVCVAGEGQGTLEILDLVGGGDEPPKKTLKMPQSVKVAELVSRVLRLCKYKMGSVGLILQWDRNKVDLMYVKRDLTIAQIGVDFTSGTTYRLLITEWLSSLSEFDEQKMPCVDHGGGPSVFIEVLDLTIGGVARTNLEIGPATTVTGLYRLIEAHHEPGTFGLLLRCRRNKIQLNDKDTRKLTEVGVDLSSLATVMLLVTEPADSPTTTPTTMTSTTTTTITAPTTTMTTTTTTDNNDQFQLRDRTWKKNSVENQEFEDPFSTEPHQFDSPSFYYSKFTNPADRINFFDDSSSKDESERIEDQGHEDVEPNQRSEIAYVGLVNQAMTCYLNSLLQALYMTPEFRNALYNWEYVNGSEKDEANSIPYQLQKLFLNLQTSLKNAIETTSLTKSFGWDSTEAWQQHDIQELCRVMFDALEQKFKNTEQADLINRLYEGKMIDYVKCLECGTEKSREDTFLDIPLPVRPFGSNVAYNSVEEALNAFVQPETLEGTNQYHCDTCNKKCDAHKGLKFTKFPYLLTLHLKRFDFDYNTFHRIKLNDEVTFPDVLNLNCFIPSTENVDSRGCIEDNDASVSVIKCEKASTTESVSLDDKCPPCDNGMSVSDHSANHDHDDDSGIDLSNGPSTSSCSTTHNHDHDNDKDNDEDNDEDHDEDKLKDKDDDNDNEKNQANGLPTPPSPKGPYEYELFSIMIHSGSASGGHYYAYIKDFRTGEWLCFNDQNVSPITYDDIQKTYGGGPTRAYYSGVYSSSTNAYMLMYRQIDPVRNALPMQVKDFPKHLQELLLKMQENQDANYREYLTQMYALKILCRRPNEDDRSISYITLFCRHDDTWAELTGRAYQSLGLNTVVPLDQVRLVTYQENTKMIECSFEGREQQTIRSILGDRRDLLMEIREKDEKFETYMPGGIVSNIYVVDVAKKEVVKGPITVRGLATQTVTEYKTQLSQIIGIEPTDINLIVQYPNNPNARLITKNDSSLLNEGFGDKIFVPTTFDASTPKTIEDGIYEIMEIFGGLISVNIQLPDTSQESLRESNIPSLAEKNKEKITEAPMTNGPSNGSPVNDGPSPRPPTPPTPPTTTTATTTTTTTTTTTEDQEKPVVNDTGKSEEYGGTWSETMLNTQGATESDEWHTPEQSNSEDSSLSYSDRTLVDEGDASEDDDYPVVGVEHELYHQTEQENWDIDDPSEYYFRATPHRDRLLNVLVDKRISLGTLKKLLEPYVGVPMEYFKIYRQSANEVECSRTVPLNFHKDGELLCLKLGRALRSGEFKAKLYQLLLDNEIEPYRNLCERIVSKDATVGQTKKEILVELKKKFDIDIPFERCRLRRKNYKTAAKVFLDDQKFKDLNLYWPYEIIVQELPGKEPVTDQNDVVIFTRRERRTPTVRLDPIQELVVSGKSIAEVREKLSEMSGIPEEYLEIAKGKTSLPSDLMLLVLQNALNWNRQSTTPENCPEITLEDGIVIYYRDWREKETEPTAEEGQDIKSKSRSRMLGISPSSRYSPRRERALKIYIDDK